MPDRAEAPHIKTLLYSNTTGIQYTNRGSKIHESEIQDKASSQRQNEERPEGRDPRHAPRRNPESDLLPDTLKEMDLRGPAAEIYLEI